MTTPPDRTSPEPDHAELLQLVADQQATINDLVSAMAAMQSAVGGLTQRVEALERRSSPSPASPLDEAPGPARHDPGET